MRQPIFYAYGGLRSSRRTPIAVMTFCTVYYRDWNLILALLALYILFIAESFNLQSI